jgi:uncharacterized C2H2 Zn-finger protein
MPHVPTVPPSSRFFARIDRFTCECPSCGLVIVAQLDATRHRSRDDETNRVRRRPRRAREVTYNALTQRLACPRCRKVYQIGLMAYPVVPRSKKAVEPSDTIPSPRQFLAIRQQAGVGFWAIDAKPSGEEVNLALDVPCTCPKPYGWHAGCPVHGWIPRGEEGGESEG